MIKKMADNNYTEVENKAIEALYALFGVEINNRKELEDWKTNFQRSN